MASSRSNAAYESSLSIRQYSDHRPRPRRATFKPRGVDGKRVPSQRRKVPDRTRWIYRTAYLLDAVCRKESLVELADRNTEHDVNEDVGRDYGAPFE